MADSAPFQRVIRKASTWEHDSTLIEKLRAKIDTLEQDTAALQRDKEDLRRVVRSQRGVIEEFEVAFEMSEDLRQDSFLEGTVNTLRDAGMGYTVCALTR